MDESENVFRLKLVEEWSSIFLQIIGFDIQSTCLKNKK
jgi:hypothetical protein